MLNDEIKLLVKFAITDKTPKNKVVSLGKLTTKDIELIKLKTGFNLIGYERILDKSSINHTLKNHGNKKAEELKGQIFVDEKDFELIPQIVKTENIIYCGKTKQGKDCILYQTEIKDTVFYVEEIRTGRKQLCLQTMYKRKPPKNGWF